MRPPVSATGACQRHRPTSPLACLCSFRMLLMVVTGWLDRREREAIAYLVEENRLLYRRRRRPPEFKVLCRMSAIAWGARRSAAGKGRQHQSNRQARSTTARVYRICRASPPGCRPSNGTLRDPERAARDDRAARSCAAHHTGVSQWARACTRLRTTASKCSDRRRVMQPICPSPTVRRSIERTDVTSAPVPHRKTSSAT
jgi:hypothetical protein